MAGRLDLLVRLRRATLGETRRHLAECLAAESRAAAAVAEAGAEEARQRTAAASLSADDAAVETYGRWFARHRALQSQAQAELDRAGAETARARGALTAARAALEAAEALRAQLAAEVRAAAGRAEQHELDDIARRPRKGP